jgi:hypothetical protein
MTKQLNLNTLLIIFLGGISTLGINKIDTMNTSIIKFQFNIETITEEVKQLRLADKRLQEEIDAIKMRP